MMRSLSIAMLCCAWTTHANHDLHPVFESPIDPADPTLAAHPFVLHSKTTDVVRASFEQQKIIPALSRPLLSSGEVLFAKHHGVRWLTQTPFRQMVLMTPTTLVQEDSRGTRQVLSSSAHPSLAAVTEVFTVLLKMNPDDLNRRFSVYAQKDDSGWVIGLVPRESAWAEWVTAMVMKGGGQRLELLQLFDGNGDRSEFQFSYGGQPNAPLTDEEQSWFSDLP